MTTRRRMLSLAAAAGVASVAGCSSSPSGGDEQEYDGAAVADVPDRAVPAVREQLPAGVGEAHVEAGLERARELLEQAPESVSASAVPNEAIRHRIERTRSDAAESVESVAESEATAEGLSDVRRAREDAAEAETMYAVSVRDRNLNDTLARGESVSEDLDAVEANYGYEGTDPVEALVTAGTAEQYLATARRILSSPTGQGDDSAVMAAAEAGGRIEKAAAYVEDARHVHERFAASVEDPRDFEATFEAALGSLRADLAERCSEYDRGDYTTPSSLVDSSVADTPAEEILQDLAWRVVGDCNRLQEGGDGHHARQLFEAHELYHRLEALSAARERIESGAFGVPADGAELDDRRAAAVDALESAVDAADHPGLLAKRIEHLPDRVARADERRVSSPSTQSVRLAAREYGYVTVVATTATDASRWLVDGLEAATE